MTVQEVRMNKNEYDEAEVVEIGEAHSIVLGRKIDWPDLDSSGMEPLDRLYVVED